MKRASDRASIAPVSVPAEVLDRCRSAPPDGAYPMRGSRGVGCATGERGGERRMPNRALDRIVHGSEELRMHR